MTPSAASQHRLGILLVACAALSWSSSGLFTRLISADVMTMLFWRGIVAGAATFGLFLVLERGRALAILSRLRWAALGVAVFSATGMITGISSLRLTTVADAMVIYATVPFVTAGLAYLYVGERPTAPTLVASVVALCGVGIMLLGAELGGSLLGKALAAGMTLSMAIYTVIMRRHREVPMLPAMAASAWICSLAVWPFAQPMGIGTADLAMCALFGVVQSATGQIFYAFGSKRIPAAEATLIAALEVPFTPFWVWLFLNETPSLQTLIGGAVVLAALFGHIVTQFRTNPRAGADTFPVQP